MTTDNQLYSQQYIYEFEFRLTSEEMGIPFQKKILGTTRFIIYLQKFFKQAIFVSGDDYKIYKLNTGLTIISPNEEKIKNISLFCEHLHNNSLTNFVIMAGDLKENTTGISKKLESEYLTYCLNRDLDLNLNMASRKVKI